MNPRRSSRTASTLRRFTSSDGFTLVEMLVVIGVIGILLGIVVPAMGPLRGSQDVTTAAYNIAGALETARAYAISNNTYTWVGFYEQDYQSTAAPGTSATMPPYPGVGHVTLGIVYSKDGSDLSNFKTLDEMRTGAVGKLINIYSVHLKPLKAPAAPTGTPGLNTANTLDGRPYPSGLDDTALKQILVNSESDLTASQSITTQKYTFYKTIRFNPRGEANMNSTLPCARIVEIGVKPTHGNVVDDNTLNVVAVQQTGIGGAVNIYRK